MMIYTEFSAAQRWPECSYKCLKLCPNQTSRAKVFSPATTYQQIETVSKIESAVRTKTQINMEKIPFIMSQHRVASDQDTIIIKQYFIKTKTTSRWQSHSLKLFVQKHAFIQ